MSFIRLFAAAVLLTGIGSLAYAEGSSVIEKQLEEIGSISDDEVVVVQRKYTTKTWRHEFTPVMLGGIPFGTVRRTLFAGASYTLHANDWLGLELVSFVYTKTFFSSFTDDLNNPANKAAGLNPNQADIKPDFQKLLYFLTAGVQLTPIYGKVSTFSRWIAYFEPFLFLGAGISKTEANTYIAFVPGIGIRLFFKEWLSMKLEFRDYIYTERFRTRTNPPVDESALRNNYAVMVSLSFWLPKMPR